MEIFAAIDTNVIVSALMKKDSVPWKILNAVYNRTIKPLMHEDILAEYKEVLARKKFGFRKSVVSATVKAFEVHGVYYSGIKTDEALPDPKDAVFYEVVLDARQKTDARLVIGNMKHFPAKPFVVTPAQLLEVIKNGDDC